MSAVTVPERDWTLAERVIIHNNLRSLSPEQRAEYYKLRCGLIGVDWRLAPYDYIDQKGVLSLYLNSTGAEQLRKQMSLSITSLSYDFIDNLVVARVEGETPDGRHDVEIGTANIRGVQGDALADAVLRAVTKAKRRLVLSMGAQGTEAEEVPTGRIVAQAVAESEEMPAPPGRIERPVRQPNDPLSPGPRIPSPEEPKTRLSDRLTVDQQEAMYNAAMERGISGIHPPDIEQEPRTQRWRDVINAISVGAIQKGVVVTIDALPEERVKPGQVWRALLALPILDPLGEAPDASPEEPHE